MPPMGGNGGSEGDGSKDPGPLKTELFLRFFHFALLFWNQTCGGRNVLFYKCLEVGKLKHQKQG